ncbi:MAG: hypothetical protein V7647_3405 [Acidobacteriota bacterium]|jgi:hypothetical protein
MNRYRSVLILVCLLSLPSQAADANDDSSSMAFPSCGTVTNRNTSHQFGQFNWIEYIVETQGVFDLCGQWFVQAEASVVGIANSGLTATGLLYASARRQVMVPAYNRMYQTNGRHYASGSLPSPYPWAWWPTGNTASFATPTAPVAENDPAQDCYNLDGVWRDTWCDLKPSSPIIVDTGRNGYSLTSVENGVYFDLDADGVAELVAWTDRDSDDEFLAMDRNGNGRIDDGSELFGNNTPAYPSGPLVTTANGFEALKFLQSPSYGASRADDVIDGRDAPFSRLLLWRDANHNGISEPDELRPASEAGVLGIATEYKEKRRRDRFDNEFRERGTIIWQDGRDALYDIWLQRRN